MKKADNDIIDIDLSVTKKKKFRIDGDNKRILELNTSDFGILSRLKESYPKLDELSEKVTGIGGEDIDQLADDIKEVDKEMRDIIDYIFDSNVSKITAPSGSMYDIINGQCRYEHIIDTLLNLYTDNIAKETKNIQARIDKHTAKYSK